MANISRSFSSCERVFATAVVPIARKIIIPNFAAAALGVWIFGRISSPTLTTVLGLALGMLVLCDMLGVWTRMARRIDVSRPLTVAAISAFSGFISGVTGAGGLLFVAVYLRMITTDKTVFRGTILLLSTLVVGWRALVMAFSGHIDREVIIESAILFPVIFAGGFLGSLVVWAHFGEALRYSPAGSAPVRIGSPALARGCADSGAIRCSRSRRRLRSHSYWQPRTVDRETGRIQPS